MRQTEIYLLAALLLDHKHEHITPAEVSSHKFSVDLEPLVQACIKYATEKGEWDIVLAMPILKGLAGNQELLRGLSVAIPINARHYLNQLKRARLAHEIVKTIEHEEFPNIYQLREGLELLTDKAQLQNSYDFNEDLDKYFQRLEVRMSGNFEKIELGIPILDSCLGYITPGEFIIVGANRKTGKTTFGLKVLGNLIRKDVPCLFLSSEMGYDSLMDRLLAMNSGNISAWKVRNGKITKEEKQELYEKSNFVYKARSRVHVISAFNMEAIREATQKTGARVVFIDYLQQFQLEMGKGMNVTNAIEQLALNIKRLATSEKVVCIGMSQLNSEGQAKGSREWESALDRMITLEELGETETIKNLKVTVNLNRFGGTKEAQFVMNKITLDINPLES